MADITYRDIVRARKSGDRELLNEVSLGRVWQHVKRSKDRSLGIVTAWRAGNTKSQNEAANKKLMQVIRSAGLGAFKLIGYWRECQEAGVPYSDCLESKLVDSKEHAFGVPGISKALIKKLRERFKQDAVIYLGPETKENAILIEKGSEFSIGKFSPQKISQAYSRIRGSTFVFEGFDYPVQNWTDALVEQASEVIDG